MALALSLVFDEGDIAEVRRLWQALADAGISREMLELGYPPHVTLLITDDDNAEDVMRQALRHGGNRSLSITLGGVKRFAGTQVVWLACDGGNALASLHANLAAQVPLQAIRPYYRPGQWTPHMTLQTQGDADAALELVRPLWREGVVLRAARLELARFLPVVVLDSAALVDQPICPASP